MNPTTNGATTHAVVSREDWLRARIALLAREKEHTRRGDELSRMRRELPWVAIEKGYRFEGPDGPVTLAELFRGRSQLVVYHFMFGPDWQEGCPSCSLLCDHLDRTIPHVTRRDVSVTAVSRAPYAKLRAFQQRMGWRFPWVSSGGSDFNRDFGVAPSDEEREAGRMSYNYGTFEGVMEDIHGLSVFVRDTGGRIFHTYSTYGRGCEPLITAYPVLDLVPKGRDEDHLPFTMAWVRHHDRYRDDEGVDPTALHPAPPGD